MFLEKEFSAFFGDKRGSGFLLNSVEPVIPIAPRSFSSFLNFLET